MRVPWHRSLRVRLVATFVALSVATVTVMGVLVYWRASQDLTGSVFDRLEAVSTLKADSMGRWLDEQRRNVVFVGSIPEVRERSAALLGGAAYQPGSPAYEQAAGELLAALDLVVTSTSDATAISVIGLDGVTVVSTSPALVGRDESSAPYFVRGRSKTSVQNVYTSEVDGRPTITVSTPLLDPDRRRIGVLAANLDIGRLDRIMAERSGLGQSGETYLVDAQTRFVGADLEGRGEAGVDAASDGINAAIAGQAGRGTYLNYAGQPVLGAYRWLPDQEVALIAELGEAEALAPARDLALTIGVVGLVSGLLLAIGIWLIARQATRPILRLAETATAVAGGDLGARSGVQSRDEVGVLAASFEAMTVQLAESVASLEARVAERTADLTAALEAQGEAERRYREVVEQVPAIVYVDVPAEGTTYVSPQIEHLLGVSAEAYMADRSTWAALLHPDDRPVIEALYEQWLDGTGGDLPDYRMVRPDGRVIWIRDRAEEVRDADGRLLREHGVMFDVTELKETEAAMERQKQYFEALVQISPVAIVTMDPALRVSAWNPAAERLFGYPPEEAIGRDIDELILLDPELRADSLDIDRSQRAGAVRHITRRQRKDGAFVDVEIIGVPLEVAGEFTGYYAIYHDITELQAARREADEANQAKSTFLAAMSHEIRTPMNAIIGMSGLLLSTGLDGDQRDYADTIRTSGDALLTIINDILDFSKIEAGRFELDDAPFDLVPLLEGALDVLAPAAAAKGIDLAYTCDPGLPARLVGDAGRVRQILLNLLSNAVKFTERGEVVMTVSGRPATTREGGLGCWRLVVDVRDTGIGIPPDGMDRLFQSFSQVDASISRRYGGTGLGLAISRRLAELMEGSLTAESTGVPGDGSTFHLAFQAEAVPEAAPRDAAPVPGGLEGRRVLVADESATHRRIVVAHLDAWGLVHRETGSARDALAWVRRGEPFDVAIVDGGLVADDGGELVTRLADIPGAPRVIALTGYGARDGGAGMAVATVAKPVKPSLLHDALVEALTGRPAVAPAARPGATPVLDTDMGDRHPLRILLAEDNPVNVKLATRLLGQMGYAPDVATNGEEAITALATADYDLVLMDVQMPELDGLEATRQIRARWPDRRLRIVGLTANAMAGDRDACLAAGMDDYVSKPILPPALAAALLATPARRPDPEVPA